MSEPLNIPCPHCGQAVSFDEDAIGKIANCPHCAMTMTLTVPGLPAGPVIGQKIEGDNATLGLVLLIVGVILCVTCYGIIIGLPLAIFGGLMYGRRKCSLCGNGVSKSARVCPGCNCQFEN